MRSRVWLRLTRIRDARQSRKLSHVSNVAGAAEMLYRALGEAHYKIVEGKEDISVAGTTAIIGGCIVPCAPGPHLAFVFVSVGDCKAFVRKASANGRIVDLTLGSRNNVSDAKVSAIAACALQWVSDGAP